MAVYESELFDPCEVEWRRQQTFHGFESKHSSRKPKSAMPIVELRPFTQKEWCRDNSLPNADYSDNKRDSMSNPLVELDPFDIIQSKVPSKSSRVHIINLSDQIMPKTSSRFPTHPPAEPRPYQRTDHRQGFTTLGQRTKTTLDEIKMGTSPSKSLSCLKQALTSRDIAKIQEIRLCGAQMRKIIERKRLQYLDPWAQYRHTDSLNMTGIVDGDRKVQYWKQLHFGSRSDPGIAVSPNNTVYDKFDLEGTLPSIQINHASVKYFKSKRMNRQKSVGPKSAHARRRIGGIKNSFQILNEVGSPANIERQLTMELEINLKHMRRNKNLALSSNSTTPRQFQNVIYRGQPTAGEIQLKKGLESNSVKNNRQSLDSARKQSSHPATIAKTDGRDSGIQSPAGSDDDSVSIQKGDSGEDVEEEKSEGREPLTRHPESSVQITTGNHTETSNLSSVNSQGDERVRPQSATCMELLRESSKMKSVGSIPALMDNRTVSTSMTERAPGSDVALLDVESAVPKPLLLLPEISPSSLALV